MTQPEGDANGLYKTIYTQTNVFSSNPSVTGGDFIPAGVAYYDGLGNLVKSERTEYDATSIQLPIAQTTIWATISQWQPANSERDHL